MAALAAAASCGTQTPMALVVQTQPPSLPHLPSRFRGVPGPRQQHHCLASPLCLASPQLRRRRLPLRAAHCGTPCLSQPTPLLLLLSPPVSTWACVLGALACSEQGWLWLQLHCQCSHRRQPGLLWSQARHRRCPSLLHPLPMSSRASRVCLVSALCENEDMVCAYNVQSSCLWHSGAASVVCTAQCAVHQSWQQGRKHWCCGLMRATDAHTRPFRTRGMLRAVFAGRVSKHLARGFVLLVRAANFNLSPLPAPLYTASTRIH